MERFLNALMQKGKEGKLEQFDPKDFMNLTLPDPDDMCGSDIDENGNMIVYCKDGGRYEYSFEDFEKIVKNSIFFKLK